MSNIDAIKSIAQKYLCYPIRRILKGLIILLWLWFLISVAIALSASKATGSISSIFDAFIGTNHIIHKSKNITPYKPPPNFKLEEFRFITYRDLLIKYMATHYVHSNNPPPIESVVVTLVSNFSFARRLVPETLENELLENNSDKDFQYKYRDEFLYQQRATIDFFARVDYRLSAAALDTKNNPNDIRLIPIEVIPIAWQSTDPEGKEKDKIAVSLPIEVLTWIKQKRDIHSFEKARDSLTNTFLLLIVLGAIGSIIFLIKDFIQSEASSTVESYIFRPILGCLLAVAMFIVDIGIHTILSSADIFSVRHETLYLLALSAGLLSEKAYLALDNRASSTIGKWLDRDNAESTGANTEIPSSSGTSEATNPEK